MAIIVNGTELKSVFYQGVDLDKVICNGVVVFEKIKEEDATYLSYFTIDEYTKSFAIQGGV